jgi:hypothetical protein
MSDKVAVPRLVADPNVAPELRALVEHARTDIPQPQQLAHLATRLDAAIAANLPGPELELPNVGTAPSIIGVKVWTTALVIGGLVVGGAVLGIGSRQPMTAPHTDKVASVATLHTAEQNSKLGDAPTPLPPPSATAQALTDTAVGATGSSNTSAAPQAKSKSQVGSEATLLSAARGALARNPERALALTDEHARNFPHGELVQEREVIAIEALRRLGRTDAARKRGSSFQSAYPESVHRSKVTQTLEDRAR